MDIGSRWDRQTDTKDGGQATSPTLQKQFVREEKKTGRQVRRHRTEGEPGLPLCKGSTAWDRILQWAADVYTGLTVGVAINVGFRIGFPEDAIAPGGHIRPDLGGGTAR